LLHAFTRREGKLPIRDAQRLAPCVLDCADSGDPVARAIVLDAGRILGGQARVSAQRVGLGADGTRVVLTGGVLEHPSPLLADTVMSHLPGALAVRTRAPPVVGALLLAFDARGLAIDAARLADDVIGRLTPATAA
jgi:N-acetylglucosamine kinase-like BadF-type ATPase